MAFCGRMEYEWIRVPTEGNMVFQARRRMLRRFVSILGIAALLAAVSFTCNRVPVESDPRTEAPSTKGPSSGPGAYDVVKMGRYGGRMGPIYFAHALHADLPGLDGKILPCSACHFKACGPPRRCGECHKGRRRGSRTGLHTT
jgi:hypothetical protein